MNRTLDELLEEKTQIEHEIDVFFEQLDALEKPSEYAVLVARKIELQSKIEAYQESH